MNLMSNVSYNCASYLRPIRYYPFHLLAACLYYNTLLLASFGRVFRVNFKRVRIDDHQQFDYEESREKNCCNIKEYTEEKGIHNFIIFFVSSYNWLLQRLTYSTYTVLLWSRISYRQMCTFATLHRILLVEYASLRKKKASPKPSDVEQLLIYTKHPIRKNLFVRQSLTACVI